VAIAAAGPTISARKSSSTISTGFTWREPGPLAGGFRAGGFSWIDCLDQHTACFLFLRRDTERVSELAVILI